MVLDQFLDNLIIMYGKSNTVKSEDRRYQFRQSVSGWLSDLLCPVQLKSAHEMGQCPRSFCTMQWYVVKLRSTAQEKTWKVSF
jgi:hypothetical protein